MNNNDFGEWQKAAFQRKFECFANGWYRTLRCKLARSGTANIMSDPLLSRTFATQDARRRPAVPRFGLAER